jgi:hypothetical protein
VRRESDGSGRAREAPKAQAGAGADSATAQKKAADSETICCFFLWRLAQIRTVYKIIISNILC